MVSNLFFFIFYSYWIMVFFIFYSYSYLRLISYFSFNIIYLLTLFLVVIFNKSIIWYQFIFKFYTINALQISYIIGLDGLSIYFILLCSFLLMYCFLAYWFLKYKINFYSFTLFLSLWLLLNIFASADLFFFYIFFEGIIIPMFLLIGVWGSRSRKIYAGYQFFLYTLFGSIFVLLCFISIYSNKGSSSFDFYLNSNFFTNRQSIFWVLMFFGFAVKVPVMPVHIWLPEAHVEAPTTGSVILAGILLKLGSYAMIRLLISFFYNIKFDIIFIILILALLGFIYGSMVALSQIDIKKIIAYSSIAHMNFSLFGLFSNSLIGVSGMLFLMIGHAITSSALFLGVGVLYDRYKTRLIFYYGSLAIFMPLFALLYFISILSNFGFPGTINFVGEFLILVGSFEFSNVIIFISTFAMILSLMYSLFLYNRIFFGILQETFIRFYSDCTRLEFMILFIFFLLIIFFGLFPNLILNLSILSIIKILLV